MKKSLIVLTIFISSFFTFAPAYAGEQVPVVETESIVTTQNPDAAICWKLGGNWRFCIGWLKIELRNDGF